MISASNASEIREVNPNVAVSNGSDELVVEASRQELLRDSDHARRLPNRSKLLKVLLPCWGNVEGTRCSVSGSWNKFRRWIKNPLNMALFLWTIYVAVPSAVLLAVLTGMLNSTLTKSQKDSWVESCGQILTALFTLLFLYHHPTRTYHLFLLKRWEPKDIALLRKVYSKNGSYTPNERFHMTVVVVAFHTNYFGQYALSGLNVGYNKSDRPKALLGIAIFFAIVGGLVSSTYPKRSPLGKECEAEPERGVEEQSSVKYAFGSRNRHMIVEHTPKWKGGLLNICDDVSVSGYALFSSCCLFGWNMERLGFGNMYVHAANFVLYCIAPVVILTSAAIHVDNETVKGVMGWSGVLASFSGVLYGGFWRIKMRERYNLPGNSWSCGNPAIADCAHWTCCCCCCALAQQVRTADYYEVLKIETRNENGGTSRTMTPEPHEDPISPPPRNENSCAGPSCEHVGSLEMKAPVPSLIPREE